MYGYVAIAIVRYITAASDWPCLFYTLGAFVLHIMASIQTQTAMLCVQFQSTGQAETVVNYSLAPHTPLLMPFSGSTGPVVYLHGLTDSRKPPVKAVLAIYFNMFGVPESVALMLRLKLDFSFCVNIRMVFAEIVTIY